MLDMVHLSQIQIGENNLQLSDINVIVGKNNSGKTQLIQNITSSINKFGTHITYSDRRTQIMNIDMMLDGIRKKLKQDEDIGYINTFSLLTEFDVLNGNIYDLSNVMLKMLKIFLMCNDKNYNYEYLIIDDDILSGLDCSNLYATLNIILSQSNEKQIFIITSSSHILDVIDDIKYNQYYNMILCERDNKTFNYYNLDINKIRELKYNYDYECGFGKLWINGDFNECFI